MSEGEENEAANASRIEVDVNKDANIKEITRQMSKILLEFKHSLQNRLVFIEEEQLAKSENVKSQSCNTFDCADRSHKIVTETTSYKAAELPFVRHRRLNRKATLFGDDRKEITTQKNFKKSRYVEEDCDMIETNQTADTYGKTIDEMAEAITKPKITDFLKNSNITLPKIDTSKCRTETYIYPEDQPTTKKPNSTTTDLIETSTQQTLTLTIEDLKKIQAKLNQSAVSEKFLQSLKKPNEQFPEKIDSKKNSATEPLEEFPLVEKPLLKSCGVNPCPPLVDQATMPAKFNENYANMLENITQNIVNGFESKLNQDKLIKDRLMRRLDQKKKIAFEDEDKREAGDIRSKTEMLLKDVERVLRNSRKSSDIKKELCAVRKTDELTNLVVKKEVESSKSAKQIDEKTNSNTKQALNSKQKNKQEKEDKVLTSKSKVIGDFNEISGSKSIKKISEQIKKPKINTETNKLKLFKRVTSDLVKNNKSEAPKIQQKPKKRPQTTPSGDAKIKPEHLKALITSSSHAIQNLERTLTAVAKSAILKAERVTKPQSKALDIKRKNTKVDMTNKKSAVNTKADVSNRKSTVNTRQELTQRKSTINAIKPRTNKSSTKSPLKHPDTSFPRSYTAPSSTWTSPIRRPTLAVSPSTMDAVSKNVHLADIYRGIKTQVMRAVREKKTFTVCGNFGAIRRALLDRGWVEKMRISLHVNEAVKKLNTLPLHSLMKEVDDKSHGAVCRRLVISKMLGPTHQVDFYWDLYGDAYRINNDKVKLTMINKLGHGALSYTSKRGLCESLREAHWYSKAGSSDLRHPRSYILVNNGDPKYFIEDFKVTAAMGLLKWITYPEERGKSKLISDSGKVPLTCFKFALEECGKALKKARHEDIDLDIKEAKEYQWNQFLEQYYKLVHLGHHFKSNGYDTEIGITGTAKEMLGSLEKHFPALYMDGFMNIWILKPVNGCRGHGIYICRTLQYIMKVIKTNSNTRYVVQKYIEKPLLIFNTKFDIRQWFLISCTDPLTIWIYKDCYLRFSSQTYNLRKLHESIHLTNNSVQCRYNKTSRDVALPDYNMWDAKEFRTYLKNIGFPNAYNKIIYPGMKESITAAILLNQDNLSKRPNSFELYGADFILTEDFKPWLLEINSRPALGPTTPVTARMCPQVLDDLIKVVIDTRKNPKAKTGNFELLYKQRIINIPNVSVNDLLLTGTRIPTPGGKAGAWKSSQEAKSLGVSKPRAKLSRCKECPAAQIKAVSKDMRGILHNLLSLVQTERERRGLRGSSYPNERNNRTPPPTPRAADSSDSVSEEKIEVRNDGSVVEVYSQKRRRAVSEGRPEVIKIKISAMEDVVDLLSKIAVKRNV